MKTLLLTLLLFSMAFYSNVFGQDTNIIKYPVSFSTSYSGDVFMNTKGGLRTGTEYLGIIHLNAGLETENLNLWKNGEFYIDVANTHGGTPSATYVGDHQVFTNIEAGNHSFLFELWYKHSFDNLSVTIGLQDLNANYIVTEVGSGFINSSFGVIPVISTNNNCPIFPLTGLGVSAQWKISEDVELLLGLFDGNPGSFESNQHNLLWHIGGDDGFYGTTEISISTNKSVGLPGKLKVGVYDIRYSALNDDNISTNFENYGSYVILDQKLTESKNDGGLSMFLQAAYSPKEKNFNFFYYGGGLTYKGLFDSRSNDLIGLAVANALFAPDEKVSETALEFFYQYQVTDYLTLKPDIQYIINPAGTEEILPNALVGILRFEISL